MLTERKSQILRIIVNDYINTAVPVASSVVAGSEGLEVSPATVRNEMVALEEEGYIHRPHISAGGVPSDKGYRQLVDWLGVLTDVGVSDAYHVRTSLEESPEDVDEWANTAASILASLLDTVAFAGSVTIDPFSVKPSHICCRTSGNPTSNIPPVMVL